MIYGDVCSGISAPTVAWSPLGWRAAFYSEIDAFPRAVLQHHHGAVPLHGDFTTIKAGDYGAIDLLVGGTPCQDFSVAGLRRGLAGERGNLTLKFLRLAGRLRPRWILWENVPGVLSLNGGRAFGAVLGGLAQLGYGFAYRVLDAQHFGVPQRRRRVFVVGYLGDWRPAAAVLFERESLRWDPAPRRAPRENIADGVAGCLGGSSQTGGFRTTDLDNSGAFIPTAAHAVPARAWAAHRDDADTLISSGLDEGHVARAVNACSTAAGRHDISVDTFVVSDPISANEGRTYTHEGKNNFRLHNVIAFDTTQVTHPANMTRADPGGPSPTLAKGGHAPSIAFSCKDHGADASEDLSPTLRGMAEVDGNANAGGQIAVAFDADNASTGDVTGAIRREQGDGGFMGVIATSSVRRLTPRECERLQGFPDDYTLVPYRGAPAKDGPRYKALGNSMAVPVVRWIGERIEMVDRLVRTR